DGSGCRRRSRADSARPVPRRRGVCICDGSDEPRRQRTRVRPPARKGSVMLLENKVAVIYGAGGGIGGAVARAFARAGAKVFLTGLHGAAVEAVAKYIVAAGGSAEAAEVDALDEQAIDKHLQSVIDKADR